jgi:ABC-type branched-subunit amino acid transport system substrate-binding protein
LARRPFVTPPPQAVATVTPAEEAEARHLWEAAQKASDGKDEQGAQAMRDALVKRYPGSEAAAWVYEARAHAAKEAGHDDQAVAALEHILFARPQYSRIGRVREDYALLLVRVGRKDDALALYQSLSRTAAGPQRARMGQAIMQPLMDAGAGRGAMEIAVEASTAPDVAEDKRAEMAAWALQVAGGALSLADAEALWRAHGQDPAWRPVAPILALRLAKNAFHQGDVAKTEAMLKVLQQNFADTPYAEQGRDFAHLMQAQHEVDGATVGVLLPLSGRYKQFGERSRLAIDQAFAHSGLKLVVKDTEGDANQAATQLEALIFEHHAIAVIGPLFSNEAMAAATKAQELGVPLLALSHRAGLNEVGPYIFRTALTVEAQAKALAKMAFEELNMTRFALLYPRSRYGMDFTQAFWDEVDKRHGEIRGVESYEPSQTTFKEPVRRLVGRWFLNARPEFREAIKALKEKNYSALRMRSEVAKLDKASPPLVDFEGLVIPDSGRQLGLIAPAVAFEDILLAKDAKALDRARRASKQSTAQAVTLMGASTWNSAQTLDACEQYCEDGVFVDAYYGNSSDTRVRDFVSAFTSRAGTEPYLSEAQAFDTAGFLARVLRQKRPQNRSVLKDALLTAEPYIGVTGRMQFDDKGELLKDLYSLTIKNHQIQLLGAPSVGRRR